MSESMTREQVLAMEPKQLNTVVADSVMQWKRVYHPATDKYVWVKSFSECGMILEYIFEDQWNPSTDIAAAWEVVEKFPIVNISRVEIFEGNYHHAVDIYKSAENESPVTVEEKIAPEAICKAALLAVMDL